jgi:hypothetical protein
MIKCFICKKEITKEQKAVIMNGPDGVRVIVHEYHNGVKWEPVVEKRCHS